MTSGRSDKAAVSTGPGVLLASIVLPARIPTGCSKAKNQKNKN